MVTASTLLSAPDPRSLAASEPRVTAPYRPSPSAPSNSRLPALRGHLRDLRTRRLARGRLARRRLRASGALSAARKEADSGAPPTAHKIGSQKSDSGARPVARKKTSSRKTGNRKISSQKVSSQKVSSQKISSQKIVSWKTGSRARPPTRKINKATPTNSLSTLRFPKI